MSIIMTIAVASAATKQDTPSGGDTLSLGSIALMQAESRTPESSRPSPTQ
ncbi:hypothetical protein [Rubripirellula lacrimiformis]|nr:hypothetical protein [Rubripirellula lacrimiformis]